MHALNSLSCPGNRRRTLSAPLGYIQVTFPAVQRKYTGVTPRFVEEVLRPLKSKKESVLSYSFIRFSKLHELLDIIPN